MDLLFHAPIVESLGQKALLRLLFALVIKQNIFCKSSLYLPVDAGRWVKYPLFP